MEKVITLCSIASTVLPSASTNTRCLDMDLSVARQSSAAQSSLPSLKSRAASTLLSQKKVPAGNWTLEVCKECTDGRTCLESRLTEKYYRAFGDFTSNRQPSEIVGLFRNGDGSIKNAMRCTNGALLRSVKNKVPRILDLAAQSKEHALDILFVCRLMTRLKIPFKSVEAFELTMLKLVEKSLSTHMGVRFITALLDPVEIEAFVGRTAADYSLELNGNDMFYIVSDMLKDSEALSNMIRNIDESRFVLCCAVLDLLWSRGRIDCFDVDPAVSKPQGSAMKSTSAARAPSRASSSKVSSLRRSVACQTSLSAKAADTTFRSPSTGVTQPSIAGSLAGNTTSATTLIATSTASRSLAASRTAAVQSAAV